MADEDISPYISWPGKTQCPWILFHANALTLLDTLYGETCSPQAKINKFITAAKRRFARSPTRGKKSKKQTYKVIHIQVKAAANKRPLQLTGNHASLRQPAVETGVSPLTHLAEVKLIPGRNGSLHLTTTGQGALLGDVGALPLLGDAGMPTPGPSRKASTIHFTSTQSNYTIAHHTAM